jgi:hypothetical protein
MKVLSDKLKAVGWHCDSNESFAECAITPVRRQDGTKFYVISQSLTLKPYPNPYSGGYTGVISRETMQEVVAVVEEFNTTMAEYGPVGLERIDTTMLPEYVQLPPKPKPVVKYPVKMMVSPEEERLLLANRETVKKYPPERPKLGIDKATPR